MVNSQRGVKTPFFNLKTRNKMKPIFIFSETSRTGIVPKNQNKAAAIAGALKDWGCIMAGADKPENFGKGMAAIGEKFNISMLPGELSKEADRLTKQDYATLDIEEKEESYNPATHAQQYTGGTSPSDVKAKKSRRKKNKAARKARRQNRK